MNKNIVCFDVETTGLSFTEDYIIQLSMVKIDEKLETIDTRDWYIKPYHHYTISQGAYETHGITKEFIEEHGVYIKDIAQDILDFVQDSDYLTYNGNSFDVRFLYKDLKVFGYEFPIKDKVFYDAFLLYKKYHPCNLSSVYKQYTGKTLEEAHNSLADVQATIEVFKGITAEQNTSYKEWAAEEECSMISPEGSVRRVTNGDIVFAVGKYKNQGVCEVYQTDPGYIKWFLNSVATPYTREILCEYYNQKTKKSK